jgi:hypothetical protein
MKFSEYLQHDAVALAEIVARGEASAGELWILRWRRVRAHNRGPMPSAV